MTKKNNLDLNKAVKLLSQGEILAFPTETVYGLGADAENPAAIQKIFEVKGRPADNPLIVHISSHEMVEQFARDVPDEAVKLMEKFWPGPLTLIFKKKSSVLDVITAGLETVALRWPRHPISQQVITMAGPLVAPSANSSGKPSPTKPEHVREDFGDDFPVIEAGETEIGLESTVLDVSQLPFIIYRPGAVSAEDIASVSGVNVETNNEQTNNNSPKSPGTKYSHYTPEATVTWLNEDESMKAPNTLYLLHIKNPDFNTDNVVSYKSNYGQMARELYDRFRQADHMGYSHVKIEPFTIVELREPLVQALQNRISKATTPAES